MARYRNKILKVKCKVKQSRYTPWRRLGERMYSSYSFTTSVLDGGEWSASHPGRALTPGKGPPVPIVQEALDTDDRGKISCPCRESNLDRPVIHLVVRHYTAWANPTARNKTDWTEKGYASNFPSGLTMKLASGVERFITTVTKSLESTPSSSEITSHMRIDVFTAVKAGSWGVDNTPPKRLHKHTRRQDPS
jgi:hypothetical protein